MTDDLASGLANERTMLAWNRTALSYLAVGGLAAKALPATVPALSRLLLAVLAVAVGVLAWLYGYARYRAHAVALAEGRGVEGHQILRALAAGTAALAIAAAVVELR